MLDKAISITATAFEGKYDKGGHPYILHCLHVMHEIRKKYPSDIELQCIAVLHDLVEDTDWDYDRLRQAGFSDRIIKGVEILTHNDRSIPYDKYVEMIALNEDARRVKLEDLRHNSDITRIKGLTHKDFERMKKYQRCFHYLSKV